ncbi:uncharacterized protein LOC135107113 [Scylla paramamosain]|uniref:uncharacterized protein LOC135107113 n=1 Tax=Scylla paramamosain TaxID=85552 RepID=UPI003082BBA2
MPVTLIEKSAVPITREHLVVDTSTKYQTVTHTRPSYGYGNDVIVVTENVINFQPSYVTQTHYETSYVTHTSIQRVPTYSSHARSFPRVPPLHLTSRHQQAEKKTPGALTFSPAKLKVAFTSPREPVAGRPWVRMEVTRTGKLQVVVWLLAVWLSGAASTKGKGKGREGGLSAPLPLPPIAAPVPPPNIHVKPYPVPLPLYPSTGRRWKPVIVTTTFYHTSLVTRDHEATSILYTTVRNTDFQYESSEAVVTNHVTVTSIKRVPVATTVTSISLTVEPQVTTVTKTVQQGTPKYFTKTTYVTRTIYEQPRITVTEQFELPYDNTQYQAVTETLYLTQTVEAKPRPPVASTVVRTEHRNTPVYVTVTVVNTEAVTTTVQQPDPQTVVVEGPCSINTKKGFGRNRNNKNSYGPY